MSLFLRMAATALLVPVLAASCGIKGPLELPEEPAAAPARVLSLLRP
ncbi:MAG: hypothetical protein V2I63_07310 [Pseudomonadales bacterium]|jgi:predicted small lipoprotein YifL|nr:hypothetical protein [Pseudomonadales bacterium]